MLIMYRENSTPSRDLKPSQELLDKIVEARELAKSFGKSATEIVKQAYDLAIRDGFHPLQARDFLMAQLPFISERTIRLALPAEAKDQTKVRNRIDNSSSNLRQIAANTDNPNIVNITTKAEIKDAELVPDPEPDEDPKDLEIQFLKEQNEELKDALHKTEQFRPATQLQQQAQPITNTDEHYFKFLTDRADGVSSFYYDTYGIDLFKNRELAQLKNSGVKVFKRLYFEV